MYISKLILKNFQAHTLLELNFQEGISILYGETDSGKSSIVRALRWIFFDDFSSNEARKLGTKETVVTVMLNSGIEISRIKSNSVNAYCVKNGDKETRFDSIGKGIPEEVSKLFGMELLDVDGVKLNLNIAEQLAAPFLLGKEFPSTFRAKLFNQLTGNDLQDKIFKELNKDILGFGREISNLEKLTTDHQKELEVLEPEQVKIDKMYDNLANSLMFLEDLNINKESYTLILQRLKENNSLVFEVNNVLNNIKLLKENVLDNIKEKVTLLNTLNPLYNRAKINYEQMGEAEAILVKIIVPSMDSVKLRTKIETLYRCKDLFAQLSSKKTLISQISDNLTQIKIPDLTLDEKYVILERLDNLKNIACKLFGNKELINRLDLYINDENKVLEIKELKLNDLKKKLLICPTCNRILEDCND